MLQSLDMNHATAATPFIRNDELKPIEPPTGTAASRLNRNIMRRFERALEKDPEVDLLSIIPKTYQRDITQGSASPSATSVLNRLTIDQLQRMVNKDPEVDLLSDFPMYYHRDYTRKKRAAEFMGATQTALPEKRGNPDPPPDILTRLDPLVTATIMFPLSDTVTTLLAKHTKFAAESKHPAQSLATSLKQTFRDSEKLWECPTRGAVLKCSDEIVAKVIRGLNDSTEYTSMQYLVEYAPDIPSPRPHGLIDFAPFKVIFMSYVPSTTLTKTWPTLTHEQKVSVQHQLDDIFGRLRKLKQPDGSVLGGVGGEGVKDLHRELYRSDKVLETGAEFEDFKFSIPHDGSESYIKFLRGLLPPSVKESVFTHGDFRTDNIMVKMDENKDCVVTGIIDWEDSGFYPDYHESTKVTNILNTRENNDWYQYLPASIAPSTFAVRWLVDRLWDRHIKYND